MKLPYPTLPTLFTFALISVSATLNLFGQTADAKPKLTSEAKEAREYSLRMLDEMKEILDEYYFDPKLRGIDLKARIEAAKTRVKSLEYNWQMYRVLVQVLMEFNDSHTKMLLPPRTDHFEYGIAWQMIGDDCHVTFVKKDSDAMSKGVEVGDQILSIGKYPPTRRDLWKIEYLLYRLDPADTLDLKLRKPDGTEKSVTIKAKTQTEKDYRAELKARKEKSKDKEDDASFKCRELGKTTVACKLYSFIVDKGDIDKMMKTAKPYANFILDLRGNGGGYVDMEQYLVSHFFDKPVKIADMIYRDKTEVRMTKAVDSDRQYKGQVIVLVDSDSASASEMTARVLQIEKRAKIFGDYSSGKVMTSITVPFRSVMSAIADAAIIKVGMSVTVGDVKMSDGSRLENTGIVPDELVQPNGLALKLKYDAALAYAASKFGVSINPLEAGKLYFLTDKAEDDDAGQK